MTERLTNKSYEKVIAVDPLWERGDTIFLKVLIPLKF